MALTFTIFLQLNFSAAGGSMNQQYDETKNQNNFQNLKYIMLIFDMYLSFQQRGEKLEQL